MKLNKEQPDNKEEILKCYREYRSRSLIFSQVSRQLKFALIEDQGDQSEYNIISVLGDMIEDVENMVEIDRHINGMNEEL